MEIFSKIFINQALCGRIISIFILITFADFNNITECGGGINITTSTYNKINGSEPNNFQDLPEHTCPETFIFIENKYNKYVINEKQTTVYFDTKRNFLFIKCDYSQDNNNFSKIWREQNFVASNETHSQNELYNYLYKKVTNIHKWEESPENIKFQPNIILPNQLQIEHQHPMIQLATDENPDISWIKVKIKSREPIENICFNDQKEISNAREYCYDEKVINSLTINNSLEENHKSNNNTNTTKLPQNIGLLAIPQTLDLLTVPQNTILNLPNVPTTIIQTPSSPITSIINHSNNTNTQYQNPLNIYEKTIEKPNINIENTKQTKIQQLNEKKTFFKNKFKSIQKTLESNKENTENIFINKTNNLNKQPLAIIPEINNIPLIEPNVNIKLNTIEPHKHNNNIKIQEIPFLGPSLSHDILQDIKIPVSSSINNNNNIIKEIPSIEEFEIANNNTEKIIRNNITNNNIKIQKIKPYQQIKTNINIINEIITELNSPETLSNSQIITKMNDIINSNTNIIRESNIQKQQIDNRIELGHQIDLEIDKAKEKYSHIINFFKVNISAFFDTFSNMAKLALGITLGIILLQSGVIPLIFKTFIHMTKWLSKSLFKATTKTISEFSKTTVLNQTSNLAPKIYNIIKGAKHLNPFSNGNLNLPKLSTLIKFLKND